MKKEIDSANQQTKKLSLSKRTISNLKPSEMHNVAVGGHEGGAHATTTERSHTCNIHKSCLIC